MNFLMISIVVGLIALAVALMLSSAIGKAPAGTARMQEIAGYIHEGAMAFLDKSIELDQLAKTVATANPGRKHDHCNS